MRPGARVHPRGIKREKNTINTSPPLRAKWLASRKWLATSPQAIWKDKTTETTPNTPKYNEKKKTRNKENATKNMDTTKNVTAMQRHQHTCTSV